MTKKIFAMFLAVLMVVSMLPTSVFAAGNNCPGKGAVHTKSNCAYTEVGKVAPNCGEKGYTTYKCNTCGDTFVADFVDPVGEHTWKDADPVAETCEKNGSVGGKECTVCGKVVDATPVDKIPNGLKCEYGEWTPANVDCTTGGEQTRTCVHCGHVDTRKVEKAEGGHVMSAWELKTPATAEASGLAVKKCTNTNCGYTVEQVVFFDHDHDATTLVAVAEIAAKCEATGVKAHYECRVCGLKFVYGKASETATVNTYNLVTDADLVIKTLHDQILETLNCTTTTYKCEVTGCGKILKVDAAAAHKYGAWVIPEGYEADCTTDGFRKRTCTVCNTDTQTEIIPALGHASVTKTVDATCVQYAYTYTYCVRNNCPLTATNEWVDEENEDWTFSTTATFAPLQEVLTDMALYLGAYDKDNKLLYVDGNYWFDEATGEYKDYRLNVTADASAAVQVYVESVEGVEDAYYIYMMEKDEDGEPVKVYIEVYSYDGGNYIGYSIRKTTKTPETYYTWNEKHQTLTTVFATTEIILAVRNTKGNYIYAIELKNLENKPEQYYIFRFSASIATDAEGKVNLIDCVPNYKGGLDADNHTLETMSEVKPTCMAAGMKIERCVLCNTVLPTKTLEKVDHKWVANTAKTDVAANCTTAGVKYLKCEYAGCNETKEEAVAATGHKLAKDGNTVIVKEHKGNHTDLLTYKYNVCTNENCPLTAIGGEKRVIIEGTYGAWTGASKIYKDLAEAQADHPNCTLTANTALDKAGNCDVAGYTAYTCSGCTNTIRVKAADGTGAHTFAGYTDAEGKVYTVAHKDATCTEDGWNIVFFCDVCKKWIDNGAVVEAEAVKFTALPKLEHTWTEFTAEEREALGLGEYVKAPCNNPVYNNYIAYCSVCNEDGLTKETLAAAIVAGSVKADTKLLDLEIADGALCTATVYELYLCHCGETHMRGFLATGVNVDHEWIVDTTKTKTEATHFEEGHVDMICKYCSAEAPEALEVIAKLPHQNKDKETFTDACNDTVTDRHCVLCCAEACKANTKHNCAADQDDKTEGVQTCACVIGKYHDNKTTYVDSICGEAPYMSEICSICHKTTATDATMYWTGSLDNKGNKVMAPITGLGHKPVAADADLYGAYTYVKDYVHPEYVWEDGVVVMTAESKIPYTAKFIEYKAATYTSEGFAKFLCADCGQTIETVLPATAGMGFELEYVNANGHDTITMGSLVNVTLYVNGNDVEVNNFTLNAKFENMIFVGAQSANDNFGIHVTKAENANNIESLVIIANAINSADKKQQNITIGEKTPIVTMQFIAWGAGKTLVEMDGEAFALNGTEVKCNSESCEIDIKMFMDFNEDGELMIADLVQAEAILTGESEKTYDVCVDVDKDGEITLYDLNLIYEFIVNSLAMDIEAANEFFFTGMDAAHVAIVREYLNMNNAKECNSSTCDAVIEAGWTHCPVCGNKQ